MADGVLLALDVGSVRVGVARARSDVRIAQPLTTLAYGEEIYNEISRLARQEGAVLLVVGWPRNLNSEATDQTRFVEEFVVKLKAQLDLPVQLQDEALTSQKAEAELQARKRPYQKADVDALAATYILEDYLQSAESARV
jgi:putative transcription antitermination factor YqgF